MARGQGKMRAQGPLAAARAATSGTYSKDEIRSCSWEKPAGPRYQDRIYSCVSYWGHKMIIPGAVSILGPAYSEPCQNPSPQPLHPSQDARRASSLAFVYPKKSIARVLLACQPRRHDLLYIVYACGALQPAAATEGQKKKAAKGRKPSVIGGREQHP